MHRLPRPDARGAEEGGEDVRLLHLAHGRCHELGLAPRVEQLRADDAPARAEGVHHVSANEWPGPQRHRLKRVALGVDLLALVREVGHGTEPAAHSMGRETRRERIVERLVVGVVLGLGRALILVALQYRGEVWEAAVPKLRHQHRATGDHSGGVGLALLGGHFAQLVETKLGDRDALVCVEVVERHGLRFARQVDVRVPHEATRVIDDESGRVERSSQRAQLVADVLDGRFLVLQLRSSAGIPPVGIGLDARLVEDRPESDRRAVAVAADQPLDLIAAAAGGLIGLGHPLNRRLVHEHHPQLVRRVEDVGVDGDLPVSQEIEAGVLGFADLVLDELAAGRSRQADGVETLVESALHEARLAVQQDLVVLECERPQAEADASFVDLAARLHADAESVEVRIIRRPPLGVLDVQAERRLGIALAVDPHAYFAPHALGQFDLDIDAIQRCVWSDEDVPQVGLRQVKQPYGLPDAAEVEALVASPAGEFLEHEAIGARLVLGRAEDSHHQRVFAGEVVGYIEAERRVAAFA